MTAKSSFEDHLRRISELLGAIPPSLVQSSTRGHVHLNIPETRTLSSSRAQGLKDLLIGKYEFGEIDADNWAHFLGMEDDSRFVLVLT